jgi:hypothetical protein
MPRRISRKDVAAKAERLARVAREGISRPSTGRGDSSDGRVTYNCSSTANWSQCPPELRALEANKATTLNVAPDADYLVRKAFVKFNLDPDNPWHWKSLIYLLAYRHFGEDGKWDENRLTLLKVRCEQYPGTNTDKIRRLREDYKEDYQHIHEDRALRHSLERAQKGMIEARPATSTLRPMTYEDYQRWAKANRIAGYD